MNNSHTLGLALFALAIIIFFGQRDMLAFFSVLASLFLPPESGFYEIILQSYYATYTLSVILMILGVVMFYKGSKKTNLTSSASAER